MRRQLEQAPPARDEQLISGPLAPAEWLAVAGERAWLDGRVDTGRGRVAARGADLRSQGLIDAALDACQRALIVDSGSSRVHPRV